MKTMKHVADLHGLGAFIRSRRRELGLTQTELAERLGYVQERISLLEHGKYGMPSLPALAGIAEALEIRLSHLLVIAGFESAAPLEDDVEDAVGHAQSPSQDSSSLAPGPAQQLHADSRRLADKVQDTHVRLLRAEDQMRVVEDLRRQLATHHETIRDLTSSMQRNTSAGE
jgi:transcriptional regulator with XRE-family HTH domain